METTYEQSIFEEEPISVIYASFWERFGALFLDGLILAPVSIINLYNHTGWKSMPVMILATLIGIVYKPLLEYLYGATPGKKALSIAVTGKTYDKPTLQEALLRNIFGIVSGIVTLIFTIMIFNNPLFEQVDSMADYNALQSQNGWSTIAIGIVSIWYLVDWIVLLADKENRSLHDMIGGTYVIKK